MSNHELTLELDGTRTVSEANLADMQTALESLTQSHRSDDAITVRSGSLRWRGDGIWMRVTMTMDTTTTTLDADEDTLAGLAVSAGLKDDLASATDAINVS
jgi:hypothetical protein